MAFAHADGAPLSDPTPADSSSSEGTEGGGWTTWLSPVVGVGSGVLAVIDRAAEQRWDLAQRRADAVGHLHRSAQVRQVTWVIQRELIATGAVSGGAASFPGAGTALTVASLGGDLAVTTVRLTDLILTIGAIHGHQAATVEERRLWVLSVLAFGDDASTSVRKIATELSSGLGAKSTVKISVELLRRLNRSLARTVISRYGRKRAALAVGKLIPFGFGAAIGASGNAMLVRSVARSSDRFMGDLPVALQRSRRPVGA